jgi:hypothetical protein
MRTKFNGNRQKQSIDRILERKSVEVPVITDSVVERAKALDVSFKNEVEGIQRDYLAQIDNILNSTSELLLKKLAAGEEAISIREVCVVLDSVRKWKNDLIEQQRLEEGMPSKITANLHAHQHRFEVEDLSLLNDEELDEKIHDTAGAIGFKLTKLDNKSTSPINDTESLDVVDETDNED